MADPDGAVLIYREEIVTMLMMIGDILLALKELNRLVAHDGEEDDDE